MDPRIATKKWLLTVERIEKKIDRLLEIADKTNPNGPSAGEDPGLAPIGASGADDEPGVPDLSPQPVSAQKRPKAAVTGG